jgi:LmbE family N-acetylglucosaminyl deacetylase
MSKPVSALYLSPHCDDIAYSLAGRILSHGYRAAQGLVVTMFTQSNFAPYAAPDLDTNEITRLRRGEEAAFCDALNLQVVSLPLSEAPLRGYWTTGALFVTREAARLDPVIATVEVWLQALARQYEPDEVYAPLGIGGHVDHLVARLAAQSVFGTRCRLLLYEDLPYAGELVEEARLAELEQAAAGLRSMLIPSGDWLAAKLKLLRLYSSQVAAKDLQTVSAYTDLIGGERVWFQG